MRARGRACNLHLLKGIELFITFLYFLLPWGFWSFWELSTSILKGDGPKSSQNIWKISRYHDTWDPLLVPRLGGSLSQVLEHELGSCKMESLLRTELGRCDTNSFSFLSSSRMARMQVSLWRDASESETCWISFQPFSGINCVRSGMESVSANARCIIWKDFMLLLCVAWILNKTICSRNWVWVSCPHKFHAHYAWTLFGFPSLALLTMQFNAGSFMFFLAEASVKLFHNSYTWNMKKLVKDTAHFSSLAWTAECFSANSFSYRGSYFFVWMILFGLPLIMVITSSCWAISLWYDFYLWSSSIKEAQRVFEEVSLWQTKKEQRSEASHDIPLCMSKVFYIPIVYIFIILKYLCIL